MRLLVPTLAVIVGLANALLYNGLGGGPWGGPPVWKIQTGPLFTAHVISAVVAGLIVSGPLLLLAGRWLRGGFFARYGLMVAAICCGGAILGVFLFGSVILLDEGQPTPQGPQILFHILFPAVVGGVLGIFEGAYLGAPLAWLLGLFGNRQAARTGPR